jgi:hypothetical protein
MNNALPRIWRSPYSDFGHIGHELLNETVTANAVYTDEVLAEIAANRFDAIWVHGLLNNLVPSRVFPEFGANSEIHLQNMRALIERAAGHGLRVYIYMQPPRGFGENDEFWDTYPELKGAPCEWETPDGAPTTFNAVCTSMPRVKEFLRDSTQTLGRELPDLGGLILITASEYPSHCYARHNMASAAGETPKEEAVLGCERCIQRPPADVIGELLHLVSEGLHSSHPAAQLIAWNWSWAYLEADPSPNIIAALPDDAILMLDFERGDTKVILGKERVIDEYSLSFAGPSQRFLRTREIAVQRGLPIMTKLQLGTTHELASVPNLPLLGNLYEKARQMRRLDVRGFMGCWSIGNMNTANSAGFNEFFNAENLLPREEALCAFAEKYFGPCDAELVRRAWEIFGSAMNNYPFSIPFIYMGPMNFTLGYEQKSGPLTGESAGRSWMHDKRGDDLKECLTESYTLDEVITGMSLVAQEWKEGAALLGAALKDATTETARKEAANAWVCYHVWRSAANTLKVYQLRLDWTDDKLPLYHEIIRDELENVRAALPYVAADDRFGFHPEAHAYLFDAASVQGKIEGLEKQLAVVGQMVAMGS